MADPWPWPPKPPRWEGAVFAFVYVTLAVFAVLWVYAVVSAITSRP